MLGKALRGFYTLITGPDDCFISSPVVKYAHRWQIRDPDSLWTLSSGLLDDDETLWVSSSSTLEEPNRYEQWTASASFTTAALWLQINAALLILWNWKSWRSLTPPDTGTHHALGGFSSRKRCMDLHLPASTRSHLLGQTSPRLCLLQTASCERSWVLCWAQCADRRIPSVGVCDGM